MLFRLHTRSHRLDFQLQPVLSGCSPCAGFPEEGPGQARVGPLPTRIIGSGLTPSGGLSVSQGQPQGWDVTVYATDASTHSGPPCHLGTRGPVPGLWSQQASQEQRSRLGSLNVLFWAPFGGWSALQPLIALLVIPTPPPTLTNPNTGSGHHRPVQGQPPYRKLAGQEGRPGPGGPLSDRGSWT